MLILVGCEESGKVSGAFRARGHTAYSCDIKPTRGVVGGAERFHLQCDVMEALDYKFWDIVILHPECTYMALSGNRYYGKDKPLHYKRLEAEQWTKTLWEAAKRCCRIGCAIENPKSTLWKVIGRPQFIHPWQFGHPEIKPTGILTHNLPELIPTEIVVGREQRIWKMGPSAERKQKRSETYQGIANAMAEQYGKDENIGEWK